jgi:hypothetical protein
MPAPEKTKRRVAYAHQIACGYAISRSAPETVALFILVRTRFVNDDSSRNNTSSRFILIQHLIHQALGLRRKQVRLFVFPLFVRQGRTLKCEGFNVV